MKKLGLVGSILLALGAFFAGGIPAFGDTGTVTVNVTAEAQSCILLDTPTINYGTLAFGATAERSVQFDSCTPAAQNVVARGTNATGVAWNLVGTGTCGGNPSLGTNQFKHVLQHLQGTPVVDVSLTTLDQSIGSLGGNVRDTSLRTTFFMPCTGSTGAGQTAGTTIVLTSSVAP